MMRKSKDKIENDYYSAIFNPIQCGELGDL